MINKIKECFLEIFKLTVLLFSGKKIKSNSSEKKVLIVFTPFIGDTILYLNVLKKLNEHYHEKGLECEIVTLNQNISIIEKYCDYDKIHAFNYSNYLFDAQYKKNIDKELFSTNYECVITPYFDLLFDSDFIAYKAKSNQKIIAARIKLYHDKIVILKILKTKIRKKAYTKFIEASNDLMEFEKQKVFMSAIGINDFTMDISFMEQKDEYESNIENDIAIIAPGASKFGKRWEPNKFASVVDYLIENTNMSVCICGSASENEIFEEIFTCLKSKNKDRVLNYFGKTTILEYIELIRQSKLVISNDSSAIHMAASVGTESICIIGGWDHLRLLPYKVEKQSNVVKSPVVVYSDYLDCFNCFDIHVGYKNSECMSCVKNKKPYPCIANISNESVINEIKNILKV